MKLEQAMPALRAGRTLRIGAMEFRQSDGSDVFASKLAAMPVDAFLSDRWEIVKEKRTVTDQVFVNAYVCRKPHADKWVEPVYNYELYYGRESARAESAGRGDCVAVALPIEIKFDLEG